MSHDNAMHLPNGMVLILKCRYHTNNDRSPTKTSEGCLTAGTILTPLCANPKCKHAPSKLGNNAIKLDDTFRPAFHMRQMVIGNGLI